MSKEIQVFEFGGRRVRTAGTHEAPLFCAADVCGVLGVENVSQACSQLDHDELTSVQHTIGRKPATYVTESGLYSLILGSRKPEAKAFKRWVTGEVLPEIRKRGFYSVFAKEQQRKTDLLLAECFPKLPSKAEPIFRELIASLLTLRGEAGRAGTPPWARYLAGCVYQWAIRVDGQQAYRRAKNAKRTPNNPDYSMLSDRALESVQAVVSAGCVVASGSHDWRDWRDKMAWHYAKRPMQLSLMVPLHVLTEKRPPAAIEPREKP